MRLTFLLGVAAIAGGAGYGKLLHDREVAAARTATRIAERPASPAPPGPTTKPVDATPRPAPGAKPEAGPAKLLPDEERLLEEPRRLVATGKFEAAKSAARDLGISSGSSPGLRLAADRLADRAQLLAVLTRAIEPHPFAGATDLLEVVLVSGTTHVARPIPAADPGDVGLALADGRHIEVKPERIAKKTALPPDAWKNKARVDLEKKRGELGDAGALEVYHVACEAFEAGLPDVGVPLLERSLALPGGEAILDVYGVGDLEVLRRAQERLRKESGVAPVVVADAGRRPRVPRERPPAPTVSPKPDLPDQPPPVPPSPPSSPGDPPRLDVPPLDPVPAPVPGPEPAPPEPAPQPAPQPAPGPAPPPGPEVEPGVPDLERLERDPHWKVAQEAYKQAVDVYRTSFGGRSSKEKDGLRRTRGLLEKAHAELDAIPNDLGDAAQTWDQFSARVNALLRDVKKRMAATGT